MQNIGLFILPVMKTFFPCCSQNALKCIIFVFSLARKIAEFFPFPPSRTMHLLFPTIPRFCAVSYKTLKGTKLDLNNGACKWLIYPHLGSATMYSNYDVIDRLGRGKRVLLHIRILFHLWLGQNSSSYIKVITIKASLWRDFQKPWTNPLEKCKFWGCFKLMFA